MNDLLFPKQRDLIKAYIDDDAALSDILWQVYVQGMKDGRQLWGKE